MGLNIKIWAERCCFVSCLMLGITIMVVAGFFLNSLVVSQAEDGVKMTKDTYRLWGVIPGDSETFTIRNFTMFNFTNSDDFIYRPGTKPKFVEVGGFLYQEKSQFLRYNYTDKQKELNFDYWLYFDLLKNSRDVNEKLRVINVGPLGFWMQLDTTALSTFALQGLGGLFVEMNATIKAQAIAQGISSTFLPEWQQFMLLCGSLGIDEDATYLFWNDPTYGIFNDANLNVWVMAAYYKDVDSLKFLNKHFFPISFRYLGPLLREIAGYSRSMDQILSNWYCGTDTCSSYQLSMKQISSSGVTGNPPPGTDAAPSICSTNSTCVGSPEIPTFLHKQFKQMFPDAKYQSLTFSEQWLSELMTPYKNLLNIGFLSSLFLLGEEFDRTQDPDLLEQIRVKLNLETEDHAFVIWEWLKYFTNQFVLKLSNGGSRKIAGLGGVFSQAIYEVGHAFASWFLQDSYSFMASSIIGKDCLKAVSFLPEESAQSICKQINVDDYTTYYSLIEPCIDSSSSQSFRLKHRINKLDMFEYCDMDDEPENLGELSLQIAKNLSDWYSCLESLPTRKCTEKDIITKQIFNSGITQRPYHDYRPAAVTAHEWNPQIPVFEYQHYLRLSGETDMQSHLEADARDLYTFDKLLNGPAVQELFIQKNDTEFGRIYHWEKPYLLRNYIRYVVIEVGFGGFTQQRSAKEIFFGYEDPFLATLRDTDTMAGGDPSISPFIAFNQLNMTSEESVINKQSMISGILDPKKYRQFTSLFNKTFISVNQTSFDGQNIKWEMVSPWAEDVPIEGTDGFAVPPNLGQNEKPTVYISSIARFAKLTHNRTFERFGLDLYDMRINKDALQSEKENPANAKYYQKIHCFLNSSYQGFPLFVSKNHFLDAEPKWAQRVDIVNQWGDVMKASEWDDTRLYVQPYTGTALSATVYLQSNYYYVPDVLFPEYETQQAETAAEQLEKMLPIVNTFRSGNVSEAAVDKYWGDLRTFTKGRKKAIFFGFCVIAFTLFVRMAWEIKQRGKVVQKNKPSLLESMTDE